MSLGSGRPGPSSKNTPAAAAIRTVRPQLSALARRPVIHQCLSARASTATVLALIADQRERRCAATAAPVRAAMRTIRRGASWAHLGFALLVAAGSVHPSLPDRRLHLRRGPGGPRRPPDGRVHRPRIEVLILVTALLAWLPPADIEVALAAHGARRDSPTRAVRRGEMGRCVAPARRLFVLVLAAVLVRRDLRHRRAVIDHAPTATAKGPVIAIAAGRRGA